MLQAAKASPCAFGILAAALLAAQTSEPRLPAKTGVQTPGVQHAMAELVPAATFAVEGHPDWMRYRGRRVGDKFKRQSRGSAGCQDQSAGDDRDCRRAVCRAGRGLRQPLDSELWRSHGWSAWMRRRAHRRRGSPWGRPTEGGHCGCPPADVWIVHRKTATLRASIQPPMQSPRTFVFLQGRSIRSLRMAPSG